MNRNLALETVQSPPILFIYPQTSPILPKRFAEVGNGLDLGNKIPLGGTFILSMCILRGVDKTWGHIVNPQAQGRPVWPP